MLCKSYTDASKEGSSAHLNDRTDRMVSSSRGLPNNMLPVAPASSGQQETIPQFISSVPDPLARRVDTLSLPWEDLDPYPFPPVAILDEVVEKLQDYPCSRIVLIEPRVAKHALVLRSSDHLQSDPSLPNLLTQPFNQTLYRNLSNLNIHPWLLEPRLSRSRASLR